jgi:hypothetical protein
MTLHKPDDPPPRRRPTYVVAGILLLALAALGVYAVTRAIRENAMPVRPGTGGPLRPPRTP